MIKEKESESFPWKKVLVIAVGVLFVAMMVFSAMGMSWLQSFRSAKVNDSVTIDFTLKDGRGQPVLTTDQQVYRVALVRGQLVFLGEPLTVMAGQIGNDAITGMDVQNYYLSRAGQQFRFGLLGLELDGIDAGVLGMKTGDTKTLRLNLSDPLVISMKNYEFEAMGGNFTTVVAGDVIPIGFSESPLVAGVEGLNNTPVNPVWRIGTVINKTANALEVGHYYPSVDITVREIR
jgi:hypothetical protein